MKLFKKQFRYYYWLVLEFFRKYGRLMLVFCLVAFFFLFILRSFLDQFLVFFSFNKERLGVVLSGNTNQIPTEVLSKISSSIVVYDDQGKLKPGLASGWTLEKGGEEFIFTFPKNLTWQDGTVFKVNDLDLTSGVTRGYQTQIISPQKIRFILKTPLVNFPSVLTVPVLKNDYLGINGDYRLANIKYSSGELKSLTLIPASKGLPFLNYNFYNTEDDLLLAYKMGEIDSFATSDSQKALLFKKWANTQVTEAVDYKKIVTIFINNQKAPFDNKNLRQALAQAINYGQLKNRGALANGPIPPFSWSYNPQVKFFTYEPELSQSLIEKNNAAGKKITLFVPYELNEVADLVDKDLQAVGLKPEVRYTPQIPSGYDLFMTTWEPNIDPDQYAFWHSSQNQTNLSKVRNLKLDKLLEDGRQELSETKRKQIYFKFQELLSEETPAIFLYHPKLYIINRKKWLNLF